MNANEADPGGDDGWVGSRLFVRGYELLPEFGTSLSEALQKDPGKQRVMLRMREKRVLHQLIGPIDQGVAEAALIDSFKYVAWNIKGELDSGKAERFMRQVEALSAEITHEAGEIARLKEQRKQLGKHITVSELPEEEQFLKLANRGKHFIESLMSLTRIGSTKVRHGSPRKSNWTTAELWFWKTPEGLRSPPPLFPALRSGHRLFQDSPAKSKFPAASNKA